MMGVFCSISGQQSGGAETQMVAGDESVAVG